MFNFFRNKAPTKSDIQKHAETLGKIKKVQFEPRKISEAENELDSDINIILSYNPVNYYAAKNRFLQCTFYYNLDYSDIYAVGILCHGQMYRKRLLQKN